MQFHSSDFLSEVSTLPTIIHLVIFFYLKYIHLCTIIQLCDFSSLEVYTPPYDYTPLLFFLPEVYTPLWDNTPLWFFSPEVYNLCAIMHLHKFYLKYTHFCAIIHLCDFFTWSIYTSVQLQTSVIFLKILKFSKPFFISGNFQRTFLISDHFLGIFFISANFLWNFLFSGNVMRIFLFLVIFQSMF